MSRWAGPWGSYLTVQRFFSTVIPWATLFWVFFRHHLYRATDVYLLAGDEVVVTKAGKHPHGLDRFFASRYGRPVPGLAFFILSLVSLQERCSFLMHVEQVVRSPAEKAASQAKAAAKKRKPSVDKRRIVYLGPTDKCDRPFASRLPGVNETVIAAQIRVGEPGSGRFISS